MNNNAGAVVPPTLFMTYSDHDEFQVYQIVLTLRKQGLEVFHYPFDIPGGSNICEGMKARPGSKMLAIALSPHSIADDWIKGEIQEKVLEPFKDSLTKVFLLNLSVLSGDALSSLPYAGDCEVIDLSSGEQYETGVTTLIRSAGLPSTAPAVPRELGYYEISGVFQPARPATTLFADLKRQIQEGNIDQKYLYWDVRAALRWQRIAVLSNYMTSQMSMNLLVRTAGDIVEEICNDAKCNRVSFVNFGVGTGVKDYHILLHLLARNKRVAYFAYDESFPMIQLTVANIEELMSANPESLGVHYIVDDFDNVKKHVGYMTEMGPPGAPKIIGFLGGSLGNFKEQRIIGEVRDMMVAKDKKDYLLLGVEYIAQRDNATLILNYSDRRMKEFLFGPIQDVTGDEPDWERDFRYEVVASSSYSGYSDVENSKTVVGKAKYGGKEIELFCSTKYERHGLEHFLTEQMGFRVIALFVDQDVPPRYGKYILKLA